MAGRPGQEQEPAARATIAPSARARTLASAARRLPQPAAVRDDTAHPPCSGDSPRRPPTRGLLPRLDLHKRLYLGLFLGLVAVSTTDGRHARARAPALRARERGSRAELDRPARRRRSRANCSWAPSASFWSAGTGRDGEPRFEGDPSIVGEGAPRKRVLAFGAWLAPADAAAVDSALERLKQRGEAFRLTARTIDAIASSTSEGRTIGGRAILRLRDVTGDRAELLHGALASLPPRAAICAR